MQVNVYINIEGRRYTLGRLDDDTGYIGFQFDQSFVDLGLQVAPLTMPLDSKVRYCPHNAFRGLPGLIADSLPDGWGNLLLDRQLQQRGQRLATLSQLERLCWVGYQGMGALEYEPAVEAELFEPEKINLDAISKNVEQVLSELPAGDALALLRSLNDSSGGARPKIVCLVSADHSLIARGSLVEAGLTPWIIKFRSKNDDPEQGFQEYITSLVARKAGVDIPNTHLFTTRNDAFFGIERFDRGLTGKLHMCTVAGLLESDFREPVLDYSHILSITARLCTFDDVLEQLRRAIFNYSIGNLDDHAKNFSFLMDAEGRWSPSPAYDLVTSESFGGEHMTTVMGYGKDVTRDQFLALAKEFGIHKSQAVEILDEVAEAVLSYDSLAREYGVRAPKAVHAI